MYENHFRLSGPPFAEMWDPGRWVALPSQERCLRRLAFSLERGQGIALLCGEPGSGKSLVARVFEERHTRRGLVWSLPGFSGESLCLALLEAWFGVTVQNHPGLSERCVSELRDRFRTLRDPHPVSDSRRGRPLLILEDCRTIAPELWDLVRQVREHTARDGRPCFDLLLVGDHDVWSVIPESWSSRIHDAATLEPLTLTEAGVLLRTRLEQVGGRDDLWEPDALSLMHAAVGGNPRKLIQVADFALLVAASREQPIVTENTARITLEDLQNTFHWAWTCPGSHRDPATVRPDADANSPADANRPTLSNRVENEAILNPSPSTSRRTPTAVAVAPNGGDRDLVENARTRPRRPMRAEIGCADASAGYERIAGTGG